MDTSTVSRELSNLSIAERILLAEELWNSVLAEQEKPDVTPEQKKEWDARLTDFYQSPETGTLWVDVKKKLSHRKCNMP